MEDNQVQVVNTFTGEVFNFEWESREQLKDVHIQLEALYKAIERAMKKTKAQLEAELGDNEQLEFMDGTQLKRFYRNTVTFRKEVVASYLDGDQLDVVTKVDNAALKTLVKELVQEGQLEKGAWDDMEKNADVKSTPYVRVIKK